MRKRKIKGIEKLKKWRGNYGVGKRKKNLSNGRKIEIEKKGILSIKKGIGKKIYESFEEKGLILRKGEIRSKGRREGKRKGSEEKIVSEWEIKEFDVIEIRRKINLKGKKIGIENYRWIGIIKRILKKLGIFRWKEKGMSDDIDRIEKERKGRRRRKRIGKEDIIKIDE